MSKRQSLAGTDRPDIIYVGLTDAVDVANVEIDDPREARVTSISSAR
jgi:hypothetical protein